MKTIYWTYRSEIIDSINLWNWNSLNWVYIPSFYLSWMFKDYKQAWLTKIIDNEINEENYIWEIAPWIKKLTRLIKCEYNETYINVVDLDKSLKNVWARFNIDTFTTLEECKIWIRNNTNLVEVSDWKFKLNEQSEWINWQIIEATYLEII
jgi:hypothetical protein